MLMDQNTNSPVSTWQAWMLASRPKTLFAAAAPVITGTALAFYEGGLHIPSAVAALLVSLLLQIGANVANDYFDYKKGADEGDRLGPVRVTQAGYLQPEAVKRGMILIFALAALLGLYLVLRGGIWVAVVGIVSILAALAYTAGPYPLAYNGLGEVFVFIFFGLVAVLGTVYVQTLQLTRLDIWAAIPPGVLIVAILVVNNLRDLAGDRAAGKRTVAVMLGERGSVTEYGILITAAFVSAGAAILLGIAPTQTLLSWATIPLGVRLFHKMETVRGRAMNGILAGTGLLALLFSLLYGAGLMLAGLGIQLGALR